MPCSKQCTVRRRDDDGTYTDEYPLDEFAATVERLEPTTTGEIVAEIGCSSNLARLRLHELADRGDVGKKETPSGYIWTVD